MGLQEACALPPCPIIFLPQNPQSNRILSPAPATAVRTSRGKAAQGLRLAISPYGTLP